MSTVNEVNIAKWVTALRSGKYTQARKRLRGEGSAMCCLGVACDISGLGKWEIDRDTALYLGWDALSYIVDDGDKSCEILPDEVAAWLFGDALTKRSAKVPRLVDEKGDVYESASCNDDLGWNFGQIADAIERTFLDGKKAEEILAAIPA